jgi:hypothetical protein
VPDTRKYSAHFLITRTLRVLFKLNNFKGCARFFKWIDDVSSREGYTLDMFPMEMRVRLAYYRGRYHLYNNEFP